jgi:thioesterase domain-containing protein
VQIWENILEVRPVGVTDSFFELGGHSLLAVRMFARIQKTWGRDLPLATLFRAPTVEQLAEILRREGWSTPWSSLVPIQPGGSRRPFFCIAPGSVLFYADLARHLGPDQPVYGLQAQGLDDDRPLPSGVEEIAGHYIKEIRTLQPCGPYLLAGRCFGSLVAFEMAQQLHAQGESVDLLVVLDDGLEALGPEVQKHLADALARKSETKRFRYYRRRLVHNIQGRKFGMALRSKAADARQAIRYWLASPQQRRIIRLEEANWDATVRYTPQVYPGRITLFRSSATASNPAKDWHMYWSQYATGGLECYVIPGTHVSILREPDVRALAEQLRNCLASLAASPDASHTIEDELGRRRPTPVLSGD